MLRLPGDTLLVVSTEPGLTWLAPSGQYLRSLPVAIWGRPRHPCRISDNKWHLLPDGSLATGFEDNLGIPGCPDAPEGTHRGTTMLERQDYLNGASLLVAAGDERLYTADATGAEIVGLDSDGSVAGTMPLPFWPTPVPTAVRAESEKVHTFENGMKEVETYDYPETYPRAGRLLVDRTQNLWVMRYPHFRAPRYSWELDAGYLSRVESEGGHWNVLDQDGRVIAEVQTPPGFFLWEAGSDYLLGTVKDEYDVEEIRLYDLRRAGS